MAQATQVHVHVLPPVAATRVIHMVMFGAFNKKEISTFVIKSSYLTLTVYTLIISQDMDIVHGGQ